MNSQDKSCRSCGFTIIELVAACFVAIIIMFFGVPAYKNTLETAKSEVCRANLRMIHDAVDLYGAEHDILPDSLAQLPRATIEKAWAGVFLHENPWIIKAANFLVDWDQQGLAYAQESLVKRYLGGNQQYLRCPADSVGSTGISYGMNEHLRRISFKQYERLRETDKQLVIAGDCRQEFFGSLSALDYRHRTVQFLKEKPFANVSLHGASRSRVARLDFQTGSEGRAFVSGDHKNAKSVLVTTSVSRNSNEYMDIELLQNRYERLLKRVQSIKDKSPSGWAEMDKDISGLLIESDTMLNLIKERLISHQKEEAQFQIELQEKAMAVKTRLNQIEQVLLQSRKNQK